MSHNPFSTPPRTPDKRIVATAIDQHATLLSKLRNEPKEDIVENLKTYFKDHREEYASKTATFTMKNKEGDREIKEAPIGKVLKHVKSHNYHFSPSMVAYTNSDVEESVNAIGTRKFVNQRDKFKKLRQHASDINDPELYNKSEHLQGAYKIFANAQSGGMAVENTPIFNPSGHTSLSSLTRCTTSTAVVVNEQLIAGNRLYTSPKVTLQAIVARITSTDLKALSDVLVKYRLAIPTAEQTQSVIRYSTRRYSCAKKDHRIIQEFIATLSGIERAAVVYILDIVNLYRFNKEFMTGFFDDWCHIPEVGSVAPVPPADSDDYVLCVGKYGEKRGEEEIHTLNAYHKQLEVKYADFIQVIFRSQIPPTNIFGVTGMIRDCVLTSDTDSSIYTIDRVANEYTQSAEMVPVLNSVLTYFIRKIALDQHYQLTMSINIAERNRKLVEMKNEYYYGAYLTTLKSKHYYAIKRMVEGVFLHDPKMDIKGVNLKSVKIAADIRDKAYDLMFRIVTAIETNAKLIAADILKEVGDMERKVIGELENGSWLWLSREGVKSKTAYQKPMAAPYFYHEMWEQVFADKYGHAPKPPYSGVKVNVDLSTKSKLTTFINSLEDTALAERLSAFCEKTGRDKFDKVTVPMEILSKLDDIPAELKAALNTRRIIGQNFKSIYIALEGTGLHFLNDKYTRLVSDEH